MKIIFLGYTDSPLVDYLKEDGNIVMTWSEPITPALVQKENPDLIISYGYRHIIQAEVLSLLPGKIINLHISYLPYNRGADPNFWSFFEDTPKGVTIHLVDEGIDTGPILVQKKVFLEEKETLRSSYEKLQSEMQMLFRENWQLIKTGKLIPVKQPVEGTLHKKKDLGKFSAVLATNGYDTPLSELLSKIK